MVYIHSDIAMILDIYFSLDLQEISKGTRVNKDV
jgi:hypothetical protein